MRGKNGLKPKLFQLFHPRTGSTASRYIYKYAMEIGCEMHSIHFVDSVLFHFF